MPTPIATRRGRRTRAVRKTPPQTRLFQVDLIPEDDGRWTVDVPDLPGCVTWGHTREEALRHAHEAILAYIDALRITGKPMPPTSPPREAVTVAITV
jgi:antitoxin HicB